jgi:hypothetical protein
MAAELEQGAERLSGCGDSLADMFPNWNVGMMETGCVVGGCQEELP